MRVFLRTLLGVLLLCSAVACKRSPPPTIADAAPPDAAPPPRTFTKLPEPPPDLADVASEAPGLEAKVLADKGYQALWQPAGEPQRALFLSVVGELLAEGGAVKTATEGLRKRNQFEAAKTLYMYVGRVGHYPETFTQNVEAELKRVRDLPHRGLWTPPAAGQLPQDWTALAMWLHNDDPTIVRERILAKRNGPFPWIDHPKPAERPWLVVRAPMMNRLIELGGVTGEVCTAMNLIPATRITQDGKQEETCESPPKPTVTLAFDEYLTKPGYVIATTEAQLDAATALVAAGDKEAFEKFVKTSPGVSLTAGNDVVKLAGTSGFLASKVQIRRKGDPATFWTVREAIEKP